MNYLAHALLSPAGRDLVLLGNMACDMLRPSDFENLSDEIKEGTVRHQAIDRMTDRHNGFKAVRDALRKAGHPYAGVLTDILFDHYLALSWKNYSTEDLRSFSDRVYTILKKNSVLIPGKFSRMTTALRKQDWFVSYTERKGLKKAIDRLNYRSSRYIDPDRIMATEESIREEAFKAFGDLMKDLYSSFGPEIPSVQA